MYVLRSIIYKFPIRQFAAVLIVAAAAVFTGCGKRGAPVPPKERVIQRAAISGFQRGNEIQISWKMPMRNAGKNSLSNIDRVDIYRLAEPLNSPRTLTEEDFSNRANIVKTLKIVDSDFDGKTLSYSDPLEFASQKVRLRYAIRFANASGQKASFSNFLLIEPAQSVAANPSELKTSVSQEKIQLSWNAPTANIDGTTPASVLGYNVYRSNSKTQPARLLNKTPVKDTSFSDEYFEFDKDYFYFVRAVSVGIESEPVESTESNIVEIKPVDRFAPTAPTAITLAVGQGVISIFFAVNPENDIAGYKIYRSTDRDLDPEKWELLTPELLTKNTFQDTRVESGKTYYYYLTATDKHDNVSQHSEIVSETIP